MSKSECKHSHLKIGFLGLGKYGYGVVKGILKSGHHNIDDIYFINLEDTLSKFEESYYKSLKDDLLSKIIGKNNIEDFWKSHHIKINEIPEKFICNHDRNGVLVISLHYERALSVLEKLSETHLQGLWVFSSTSFLTVKEITDKLANKCTVLRYLQNMGTKVGQGIIAAHIDQLLQKEYQDEGEIIFRKVFQGLGKIYFVKKEEQINAARVIIGSTIGVVAYLSKQIADALKALNEDGLGNTEDMAMEIVYHSVAGALALGKERDVTTWNDIVKQVSRTHEGGKGVTDFIIGELNKKNIPEIIGSSYKLCFEEYLAKKI
jgi:pyrroline-5-carboxylate reductase